MFNLLWHTGLVVNVVWIDSARMPADAFLCSVVLCMGELCNRGLSLVWTH